MKSHQEIEKIAEKWAAHSIGVCTIAGAEMTDSARISESIKGAITEAAAPAWTPVKIKCSECWREL